MVFVIVNAPAFTLVLVFMAVLLSLRGEVLVVDSLTSAWEATNLPMPYAGGTTGLTPAFTLVLVFMAYLLSLRGEVLLVSFARTRAGPNRCRYQRSCLKRRLLAGLHVRPGLHGFLLSLLICCLLFSPLSHANGVPSSRRCRCDTLATRK
jgi:hypothetical protein